jgi:hypothetical protein
LLFFLIFFLICVARNGEKLTTFAVAASVGSLFSVGLAMSGMTNPDNLLACLDPLNHNWNPSLLFVFGGALGVNLPLFRLTCFLAKVSFRFGLPSSQIHPVAISASSPCKVGRPYFNHD